MSKSKILIITIFGVMLLSTVYHFYFVESREEKLMRFGNEIVKEIDQFVRERNRLPRSLEEIGIEEKLEGPIFYELRGSGEYILWFGTDLGESMTYHSRDKRWGGCKIQRDFTTPTQVNQEARRS